MKTLKVIGKNISGRIVPLYALVALVLVFGGFYLYTTLPVSAATTLTDSYTDYSKIEAVPPGTPVRYWVTGGQLKLNHFWPLGTGADGTCTVAGAVNINTGTCVGRGNGDAVNFTSTANTAAGSTSITLSSTPTGLAVGDEVLIINMQGTTDNFANVGKYETHIISSISTNTLNFTDLPLTNSYDGTTQKIMVQRIPQYTNVNINSGSLVPSAWNGTKGGVLAFRATGTVTVASGASINANTLGFLGALGWKECGGSGLGGGGESYCGARTAACCGCNPGNSGAAGGGGTVTGGTGYCGGGGTPNGSGSGGSGGSGAGGGSGSGGGYGTFGYGTVQNGGTNTSGSGGGGGGTFGVADLSKLYLGTGGGGGGNYGAGSGGGDGGKGGGIVFIAANAVSLTGTINSDGQAGLNGYNGYFTGGGGGGGSGGSVYLYLGSAGGIGTTKITALNGAAGNNGGQAGGMGRIAVYNASSGSSNPAYTATSAFPIPMVKSTNLLAGESAVDIVDTFTYNLSSISQNTTATVQFSQNGTNWYNSTGTLNGSDTLSVGNNSIPLSGSGKLNWSGASFYYRFWLSGTATGTAVFDSISLGYRVYLRPPTIGTPTALSTTSIRWNFTDNSDDEDGFHLFNTSNQQVASGSANISYIDETGLTANTSYTRKVASWSNLRGNGSYSSTATISTLSNVPPRPSVTSGTISTFVVNPNPPAGAIGTDTYAIYITTGACDGSNANLYLNKATGNLGAIDWQTETNWATTTVNNLDLEHNKYFVCVKAKNISNDVTGFGPADSSNGGYISTDGSVYVGGSIVNKFRDGSYPAETRYIIGVDNATGSTANTGVFEISEGATLNVNNNETYVFGSLSLTSGSVTINNGAVLKPGSKMWVADHDGDGKPRKNTNMPNDLPVYVGINAPSVDGGVNVVRKKAIPTFNLTAPDCNDGNSAVWAPHSACLIDVDGDGYTTGSVAGGGATCLNTSSCTTATSYSTATNGAASANVAAGTMNNASSGTDCNDTGTNSANVYLTISGNCYVDADNDDAGDIRTTVAAVTCGNNATCGSATWASGANGTAAASGNFATTRDDCNDSLSTVQPDSAPGSPACGTTSFTKYAANGSSSASYDYNCNGTQAYCGTALDRTGVAGCTNQSGWSCGCGRYCQQCCGSSCHNSYAVVAQPACGATGYYCTSTFSYCGPAVCGCPGTFCDGVAQSTQGCQ